ncbi:MAG TPA: hypothetical protein VFV33_20620 [Gemmatimonadaceae bacterium]|nr:hypothetical protein [Gemmatimonadaceae bacterium]
MSQYIRRAPWTAVTALAALTVSLVACGGEKKGDGALSQDTTLARDLARVGGDTAVQPQLQDVPAAEPTPEPTPAAPPPAATPRPKPRPAAPKPTRPAPSAPAPTPTPAPATTPGGNVAEKGTGTAEKMGTVAAGTTLDLGAADKVCTNTNKVGDRFIATLNAPVTGSDGAVIPAGAAVTIELTTLKRSENANDQIQIGFRVINISFDGRTYALDGDVQTADITRVRSSSGGNDAKKVIGGAVAGAVIGQILGKKAKSTIIGAAAGAAAGGAAAAATANYDGCVNAGGHITVKLNAPVTVAVK